MGKMNAIILVADDDEFVREVLRTMLTDSSVSNQSNSDLLHISEVIEASDGRRAVEAFMDRHPDLVLMDVVMPGMDGIEATKEIIVHDPKAIVLAITAFLSLIHI